MQWLGWAVGIGAFPGLVLAAHRGATARLRMVLALAATAALLVLFTGEAAALAFFALDVLLVVGTRRLARTRIWHVWIGVIVALLVASKLPAALAGTSHDVSLGGDSLVLWVGFSYLAFRLIHVTVEAHAGRLGDVTFEEFVTYALHPASFVAGPIDRVRTSAASQRREAPLAEDLHQGAWRILLGVFTKFVIANTLFAFIAQHDMTRNPDRPIHIAWLWLVAYSFYLLADFAAYTHIAINFGRLAGITLPENFDRPYLSTSIAQFWQRWHITLSNWVRDYIFFPVARSLRARAGNRFRAPIQFAAHMTTMGAVGLWHGLTPAFLIWGLWHGLGLFLHGQFGARRPRKDGEGAAARLRTATSIAGTWLFVTLGWVFFAADLPTALRIFARLFGLS